MKSGFSRPIRRFKIERTNIDRSNQGAMLKKEYTPRFIYTTLATYMWPILYALFWLSCVFRPSIYTIPDMQGRRKAEFIPGVNPEFLTHVSDLHLSDGSVQHSAKVWRIFHNMSELVRPKATIITGDITDGGAKKGRLTVHGQFEKNWRPFLQIRDDHSNLRVIASAGNHDEIMVASASHKLHLYNRYINDGNASDFVMKSHYVDIGRDKLKVIVFNPFTFPVPPIPLYLFAEPTVEMLDNLEAEIQRDDGSTEVIVACHYPIQSTASRSKNSKGKTLEEILVSNNVRYYLVGHFHTNGYTYHRMNNTIEVIAVPPLKVNYMGVIANDNDVWSYTICDLDDDYISILSFPPPMDQFTEKNPYVDNDFRVRFIVFDKHPLTLSLSVDGVEKGRLERDYEDEKYVIYGFDLSLENGPHKLVIDGDITLEREFLVGDSSKQTYELGVSFYLRLEPIWGVVIWCQSLTILHFLLPPILNRFFKAQMKQFGDWLFREKNPKKIDHKGPFLKTKKAATFCCCVSLNVFKSITLGPLYSIWRYYSVSKKIKVWLLVLYGVIATLPFYYVKGADNKLGVVWSWGFSATQKTTVDIYTLLYFTFLTYLIIVSLHFLAGLVTEAHRWSYRLAVEFIGWTCPVIFGMWLAPMLSYMGGGLFSLLTNPFLYITIPIIVFIMKMIFDEKKRIQNLKKE